ncbi:hypothetical protein L3X07_08750 [Levilactobacillus brevis]|nr:hypothetical protein [Levilactobacillus brevis]
MDRRIGLSVMGLVAVAILVGCGKQQASQNKTLNVTMPAELQTADPNKATDAYSFYMMKQTTEDYIDSIIKEKSLLELPLKLCNQLITARLIRLRCDIMRSGVTGSSNSSGFC